MEELFWDEAEGCFIRLVRTKTSYDHRARRWVCRCERFALIGSCWHIMRWRPQVTLKILECYL